MSEKKIVLISGATGGLGSSLTKAFLEKGRKVIALGRDFAALECVKASSNLQFIAHDLTQEDDFKRLEKTIENIEIDTIINAAGTSIGVGPIDAVVVEDWRYNIEVNFLSAIRINNLILPQMKERKSGSIINVTSMAAKEPLSWLAPYCVSKAALKHYTMCLSQEMKPFNIRVNSLGICADTFLYNNHRKQKQKKGYYGDAPMRDIKMPQPEENLPLFLFLASDKGEHISGQHIECHSDII